MIPIANSDFVKVKRLLHALCMVAPATLRGYEDRRQALLLLRKWERREKRSIIASNFKDV